MTHFTVKSRCLGLFVVLCMLAGSGFAFGAKNQILGEIRLEATNKAAKSSGVWIDGQYLGYLQELRGSRKILLMPGKHEIAVRQAGYMEFRRSVVVEPGQTREIPGNLLQDPRGVERSDPSELKLPVEPARGTASVT